ncbi:hypothetical protein KCH_19020 [Kitasatospora cheerisanensis KCTC 2395]|uniref:Uncharacterized protein n=1 Tax=Kitasatospora cheerisanensis KCTC 2395 TaxID=1348663 RepID=A0A066Z7C4_9ACTN|nr:hypothetical protein KCH_19020 [Kitasatospora cheerisanensis KCTC 2395]
MWRAPSRFALRRTRSPKAAGSGCPSRAAARDQLAVGSAAQARASSASSRVSPRSTAASRESVNSRARTSSSGPRRSASRSPTSRSRPTGRLSSTDRRPGTAVPRAAGDVGARRRCDGATAATGRRRPGGPAELEDPVAEQRVLHRLAPARGIGQAEPVAAERVHTRGVALDRRVACGEHGRESPAVDRGAPVDPVEGLGDGQEDLPDDAVRRGEPDVVLRAEQESPEGHLREGSQIAHHQGLGCADDVQDAQLPRPDRAAAPAARRPGVPRPHRGRPDQQPGTPPHRSLCTHDSFLTSACPTRRSCPPGSGAARTGRESRRPGCDVRHFRGGLGVQGVR